MIKLTHYKYHAGNINTTPFFFYLKQETFPRYFFLNLNVISVVFIRRHYHSLKMPYKLTVQYSANRIAKVKAFLQISSFSEEEPVSEKV